MRAEDLEFATFFNQQVQHVTANVRRRQRLKRNNNIYYSQWIAPGNSNLELPQRSGIEKGQMAQCRLPETMSALCSRSTLRECWP